MNRLPYMQHAGTCTHSITHATENPSPKKKKVQIVALKMYRDTKRSMRPVLKLQKHLLPGCWMTMFCTDNYP